MFAVPDIGESLDQVRIHPKITPVHLGQDGHHVPGRLFLEIAARSLHDPAPEPTLACLK